MAQLRRTKGKKERRARREYWQRNVKTSISNHNAKIKKISTQIYEETPNDFNATSDKMAKINKTTIG